MTFIRKFSFLTSLIFLAALHAQAEVTIRAFFDPPKIAMGEHSVYTVEIKESDSQRMPELEQMTTLPIGEQPGLAFRNGSIQHGIPQRININGEVTYSVSQTLQVQAIPSQTGVFKIPAYTIRYKGDEYTVNSSSLQVVEKGSDTTPSVNELIYLKVEVPKTLYLGQTVETELKLYISSGVRLRGLNGFEKDADGFTSSPLPDDPEESSEFINGQAYRIISWPIQLTPIRSGAQNLGFQFTITAQIPQQGQSRNRPRGFNSPFGSDIFDNFFGQTTEQFNIYTDPMQIDVLPLPDAGKPASFSGAIGDFNLQVFADSEETTVGEPIMLSLKLSGTGNFDRITGPKLPDSPQWHHYKPESTFTPKDDNETRGTKRFDYVFIPEKAGKLSLPAVNFSFFDPETKEYVELTSPAIPVNVKPSLIPQAPIPNTPLTNSQSAAPAAKDSAPQIELDPLKKLLVLDYQPKPGKSIDTNPLHSSWFWPTNIALAILSIIWFGFRKRTEHLKSLPGYAQIQSAKAEMKAAQARAIESIQSKSADAFYLSIQQMIRAALTARGKRNFQSAGKTEILAACTRAGLAEMDVSRIGDLFEKGNALRFSGIQENNASNATSWQQELDELNRILKKL